MKIEVIEKGFIELQEVFNPIIFKSTNGEKLQVQMRDGGFEVIYNNTRYRLAGGESSIAPCKNNEKLTSK